jgi:hypothetical protein
MEKSFCFWQNKNTAEEKEKIEKDHCQHPGKQLPFNCE